MKFKDPRSSAHKRKNNRSAFFGTIVIKPSFQRSSSPLDDQVKYPGPPQSSIASLTEPTYATSTPYPVSCHSRTLTLLSPYV